MEKHMATCQENHRYNESNLELGPSQAAEGRHKCVGCAYLAGFQDGFNGKESDFQKVAESLAESQAGTGRHRNAEEAYRKGYQQGEAEAQGKSS